MDHLGAVKHPQVPAVARLALDVDEGGPAGFIGIPVMGAAQALRRRANKAVLIGSNKEAIFCKPPARVPADMIKPWLARSCSKRWLGWPWRNLLSKTSVQTEIPYLPCLMSLGSVLAAKMVFESGQVQMRR
jgi:hypothetical protein